MGEIAGNYLMEVYGFARATEHSRHSETFKQICSQSEWRSSTAMKIHLGGSLIVISSYRGVTKEFKKKGGVFIAWKPVCTCLIVLHLIVKGTTCVVVVYENNKIET